MIPVNLVDSVYLTFIIYKRINRRGMSQEKIVVLKNYFSDGTTPKGPIPTAIRRIVQIAIGLMERANKETEARPRLKE